MRIAYFILLLFSGTIFAQCPGTATQPLPFGGVEATDSANGVTDSVCGFEYPCDSATYFVWFAFEDTFYNGMRISIESSRADSASILVVAGCNTVLNAVCRDIDITQEILLDHIGGLVSIHIAVPNPAKITVRVEHATQPTQPPNMNFTYTCSPLWLPDRFIDYEPRQIAKYFNLETGKIIVR